MPFLNKITFTEDFRCFKQGDSVEFKSPVTVLTGDNGSGKSTMIASIRAAFKTDWSFSDDQHCAGKITTNVEDASSQEIAYLCFSGDLLKHAGAFGDDMMMQIKVQRMSSGEGALEQLIDKVERSKHLPLLILDEPERGLSIKRQLLIFKYLKRHAEQNPHQQIIVVTHSTTIMKLNSEVYSTSHKAYMNDQEYMLWMFQHNSVSPFADE